MAKLALTSLGWLAMVQILGLAPAVSDDAAASDRALLIAEAAEQAPIGTCWMEPDGTIVLDLRRTADGVNISMPPRRVAPTDANYAEILAHVGPLTPGETKLVMPWPDQPQ